jgi:hypothetical protein
LIAIAAVLILIGVGVEPEHGQSQPIACLLLIR